MTQRAGSVYSLLPLLVSNLPLIHRMESRSVPLNLAAALRTYSGWPIDCCICHFRVYHSLGPYLTGDYCLMGALVVPAAISEHYCKAPTEAFQCGSTDLGASMPAGTQRLADCASTYLCLVAP